MTLSVPPRRRLPAVDAVLRNPALAPLLATLPRALVVEGVRAVLAEERARLTNGGEPADSATLAQRAAGRAQATARPTLVRVLNATGVVLHTNLGRAPLAERARRAVADVAQGYASVELDLTTGRRGTRAPGVEQWLQRLTGAEAALVVNNGAAAVLLALSALASGRGVVVSRGELVEIGGSFRIPEILEKSGARLIEVGTTNRTHLRDYERALARHDDVAAILRVHPSNFRVEGFTARPELRALVELARKRRVPLIEDLGSGALVDLTPFGLAHEPTVAESLAAGCPLVTCSGDKLLGSAQAGLVLGEARLVNALRKDPLARALRLDKLQLAALEATLSLYADPARARAEVPVLAMLTTAPEVLKTRALALAAALGAAVTGLTAEVVSGAGEVGGGALPRQPLPGFVVELRHPRLDAVEMERRGRAADPPVLGTIRAGRWRLDPWTLTDDEVETLVRALARAFAR